MAKKKSREIKIPITIYLNETSFDKVEQNRGDIKRSTYLEKMIDANV